MPSVHPIFISIFQQLKTYLFLPHLHSVESIKQLNGPNVLGTKEPSCDADILFLKHAWITAGLRCSDDLHSPQINTTRDKSPHCHGKVHLLFKMILGLPIKLHKFS